MKGIGLGLIFLVLCLGLRAQSPDPGPAQDEAVAAKDLPGLIALSRDLLRREPGKALEYARMAEKLLERHGEEQSERSVLDLICLASLYLGEYDQALDYAQKNLVLTRRMDPLKGTGIALTTLANIYNQKGEYARAREAAYEAEEIFKRLGEKKALAAVQNSIGIGFDMQGNYEKALDYYLRSLKLKEELGDREMIARSLNNVGVVHKLLGNTQAALEYYTRALHLKEELGDKSGIAAQYINLGNLIEETQERAGALAYYQKALALYREQDEPTGIASALYNIGLLETRSGSFRTALGFFLQSLALRQKMGEKEGIAQTLIELGKVYARLRMPERALKNLEDGLALAEEIGAKAHVMAASQALSGIHEARQNHQQALRHYKAFKEAADAIFNRDSSQKIAGLQARFESEKQEQEILLLKKNGEIQQLRLNRQEILRNLMFAVLTLVVGVVLLLAHRYRYIFTFWKKRNYIGHYRIIEPMGSGGMGTVYRAADVVDSGHRMLAVKVLREEFFADEVSKKRFKQEATIIDSVVHPHIVRVVERGETDEGLYIAMEVLEGPTLTQFLAQNPKPDLGVSAAILLQIADALKSIHAMNIVHRDLKPDNIKLVEREGDAHFVKLLDFGLAITQSMNRLTETGFVLGTIHYLSPEQFSGEAITTACDIHSLGVIGYEMLTGMKPFPGETTLDVMRQILVGDPIDVAVFRPDLPRILTDLIMLMLRKVPRQRPTAVMVYDLLAGLEEKKGPQSGTL